MSESLHVMPEEPAATASQLTRQSLPLPQAVQFPSFMEASLVKIVRDISDSGHCDPESQTGGGMESCSAPPCINEGKTQLQDNEFLQTAVKGVMDSVTGDSYTWASRGDQKNSTTASTTSDVENEDNNAEERQMEAIVKVEGYALQCATKDIKRVGLGQKHASGMKADKFEDLKDSLEEVWSYIGSVMVYWPVVLLSVPCLAVLSVPVIGAALLALLAITPLLALAAPVLFASVPWIWPRLSIPEDRMSLSSGACLSLCIIAVPITLLSSIPLLIVGPLLLVFLFPLMGLLIPVFLMFAIPIVATVNILFGSLLVFYYSPLSEWCLVQLRGLGDRIAKSLSRTTLLVYSTGAAVKLNSRIKSCCH